MRWFLLLVLLLCPAVQAESWSQKGASWIHTGGFSITFTDDFQVRQSKEGILSATAKGGFVSLTFTPVHGEEEMKQVMGSAQEVFNIRKVVLEKDTHTAQQNGLELAFQDGKTTINDIEYLAKLGLYKKKHDFLVMQLLVPRQLLPKTETMLRQVLGSVR